MAKSICKVPINQITSQITMTVKIKGMKQWQVKLWSARHIIIIASFIASRLIGTKLEVEKELNG